MANYILTDFYVAGAEKTNERLICVRQMSSKSNRKLSSKFQVPLFVSKI